MFVYILLVLMGMYLTGLTIYAFGVKRLPKQFCSAPIYRVEIHDWSRKFPALYKLEFLFCRWPTIAGLQTALGEKRQEVKKWNLPKQDMLTLIDHFSNSLAFADREKLAKQHKHDIYYHDDHVGGVHIYDGDEPLSAIGIYVEKSWR